LTAAVVVCIYIIILFLLNKYRNLLFFQRYIQWNVCFLTNHNRRRKEMIRKIKNILKSHDNTATANESPVQYDMVSTDSISSCKSNHTTDKSKNSSPKINFIKRSKYFYINIC